MIEAALISLAIIAFIAGVFWVGMTSGRNQARRDDLEDWSGVMDVKRETKRELSDPDELERMHDKYNDD